MARKRNKNNNILLIGIVLTIAIAIFLFYDNKNTGDELFFYSGYHKYTSNQFRPLDACFDRYYVYRDEKGISDELLFDCIASSNDDLNKGGNLECSCFEI